jgi:hypothetical protein
VGVIRAGGFAAAGRSDVASRSPRAAQQKGRERPALSVCFGQSLTGNGIGIKSFSAYTLGPSVRPRATRS